MLIKKFLNVALNHGDMPALAIQDRLYSYGELLFIIRQLAHCIQAHDQPKRIGIFCYKTHLAYAGILASLYTGCTFVPLNKNFPLLRNLSILEQAPLDIIIVDAPSKPYLKQAVQQLSYSPTILEESDLNDVLVNNENYPTPTPLSDIAYILFTSGSTGSPKGVQISRGALETFIDYNQKRYHITPADKLSQTFDLTFDLALFDVFMALCHGALLCVPQPIALLSPAVFVEENKLSVWFSVPSIINLARKRGLLTQYAMPSLRLSLFCGEPLTMDAAKTWQQAAPNAILENLYGPTELTIACSHFRYIQSGINHGTVPIGDIYPHLRYKLLDAHQQEVPKEMGGELAVAGPQLFSGYLQDDMKTARATITLAGETYYRTGDHIKHTQDGLIYLGRLDQQIKVNGYRVELSEVENVLRCHPTVIDAIVVGYPENEGTYNGLVAFVTGTITDTDAILTEVKKRLPHYMVPNRLIGLERMPLTANQKIDRNALKNTLYEKEVAI